jgi:putative acetyltransferase
MTTTIRPERPERPDDIDAITRVTAAAFGREDEARIVTRTRDSDNFVPALSLVADEDGQIVGHVMVSYADLMPHPSGWGGESEPRRILLLGPISVEPSRQGDGIGGALMRSAIDAADAMGEPAIVLLGHPTYYPRFGFESARALGIEPPDDRIPDGPWMARKLSRYDASFRGRVIYPPPFADAENVPPPERPNP